MIFISSLCPFFIKLHDHASVVADCNDSNISSNTTELETASIQMFGLSPLRSGKWRQLTWPLALCIVQLMELWILIRFEHYLTYFLLFHFFFGLDLSDMILKFELFDFCFMKREFLYVFLVYSVYGKTRSQRKQHHLNRWSLVITARMARSGWFEVRFLFFFNFLFTLSVFRLLICTKLKNTTIQAMKPKVKMIEQL